MSDAGMDSRRNVMKKVGKTAVFAIPTLATFHFSALKVAASGNHGVGNGGGGGNGTGNEGNGKGPR